MRSGVFLFTLQHQVSTSVERVNRKAQSLAMSMSRVAAYETLLSV